MAFLSSIWLFALIPWSLFTLWMLVGRRRRQWVPFLALWDAPEEIRRPKKGFEPPPKSLVLALLALLLGILAMSQPRLWSPNQVLDRGRITLIVDRGASMSALINGQPRYATLAKEVGPALVSQFGLGSVDLIDAATGELHHTDRSDWYGQVPQWKRTALDTAPLLKTTVAQQLQRNQPTILLSDRDLGLTSDQLLQIKPKTPVQNAGIINLANRPGQVMVTLRATDATTRLLRVTSGTKTVEQTVTLEPGPDQNIFLDLDTSADTIQAILAADPKVPDNYEGDDLAWLTRRQSAPVIEPRIALPEEVRRVITVYARHRPPGDSSAKLPIARPGELKADEPGILLAPVTGTESPKGDLTTRPHPLLNGISDWHAIAAGASLASSRPGEGWTNLISQGNQPLVAVKETDARQVWIGFESREFARTPAFVIFWANIFDWTAGGQEAFTAAPIAQAAGPAQRLSPEPLPDNVDPAYWPGLFQSSQGKIAVNPPPVTFTQASTDWQSRLSSLHLPPGTGVDLTPWLAIAAIFCLAGAASTWEMRRRQPKGTALNRAIA